MQTIQFERASESEALFDNAVVNKVRVAQLSFLNSFQYVCN